MSADSWHKDYQDKFTAYYEAAAALAELVEDSAVALGDEARTLADDIRQHALQVSSDCEALLGKPVRPCRCFYSDGYLKYDGSASSAGMMWVARCGVCRAVVAALPRPGTPDLLRALGHTVNGEQVVCKKCSIG